MLYGNLGRAYYWPVAQTRTWCFVDGLNSGHRIIARRVFHLEEIMNFYTPQRVRSIDTTELLPTLYTSTACRPCTEQ